MNPVASPPYADGYVVHTFTSSGTYSNSSAVSADVLVLAGGSGGYDLQGGTLVFVSGATISNSDNRHHHTLSGTITGSPAVHTKDAGAGYTYEGLKFSPAVGHTQTLGAALNPNNTGVHHCRQ